MEAFGSGQHALVDAVADGVLGAEVAFCGLRAEDVERLSARYPEALVLVRLRNAWADGRTVMPIAEFSRWTKSGEVLLVGERLWKSEDIRDVFPLPVRSEER